jgi:hypothetical protein
MKQTFENGNKKISQRRITIKIDEHFILFSFPTERNREFYDIPKHEWLSAQDNWQNHMREKSWFTEEMENFINQALKLKSVPQ